MKRAVLVLTLLGACAGRAAAVCNPDSTAFREVRAIRATSPLDVDGALSEAAWEQAPVADWFTQRDPDEGREPTQRTEVRLLYDAAALHVGARMHDTSPDSIIARLTRRDVGIHSDEFVVYLDPYYDRRSGYFFSVNAGGTLYDSTLSNDGAIDNAWDGVWDGRARRDDQGWIPLGVHARLRPVPGVDAGAHPRRERRHVRLRSVVPAAGAGGRGQRLLGEGDVLPEPVSLPTTRGTTRPGTSRAVVASRRQVLLDGREISVKVGKARGPVFVDEIQVDVPIEVDDPVTEPRHMAHRIGDGCRKDPMLLQDREQVSMIRRNTEPIRRRDVRRDLDASLDRVLEGVQHGVLTLTIRPEGVARRTRELLEILPEESNPVDPVLEFATIGDHGSALSREILVTVVLDVQVSSDRTSAKVLENDGIPREQHPAGGGYFELNVERRSPQRNEVEGPFPHLPLEHLVEIVVRPVLGFGVRSQLGEIDVAQPVRSPGRGRSEQVCHCDAGPVEEPPEGVRIDRPSRA